MQFIWVIIGFVSLGAYLAVINSLVLSTMWGWFIVPLFHLPALSPVLAFTVLLTLACVRQDNIAKEETDQARVIASFLKPWIILLAGYIVKQFI